MNRQAIFLRVSVTDACNLRCCYCRSSDDCPPTDSSNKLTTDEMITLLRFLQQRVGINKLRFTGGEPLLRRDLAVLIANVRDLGVKDISLTTNGQLLAGKAVQLKESGLSRINISLDSLNPDTYSVITRGGKLDNCIDGIQEALVQGISPVKLNMALLRGVNDQEITDLVNFGLQTGCQVRFLELMPVGVASEIFDQRFFPWSEAYDRIESHFNLQPLPYQAGSTSRDFEVKDARGRSTVCGFISPTSHPFCKGCKRLRLTNDGRLLGCLAKCESIDLRPALDRALGGDPTPLGELVASALSIKLGVHNLADQNNMVRIGG